MARSDYGLLRPLLEDITESGRLELYLYVSGMHLAPEYGRTIDEVRQDFEVFETVDSLVSSTSSEGIGESIGNGVSGFAECFEQFAPDVLVLLGDRFDMFAAGVAALPFNIPIAHIHGGEVTAGAIDDSFRHALSKFSQIHFTATEQARRRVIQMGEAPERVFWTGSPALDRIEQTETRPASELAECYDLPAEEGYLLVTFHPVTRDVSKNRGYARALREALEKSGRPVVCTLTNADTEGEAINEELKKLEETTGERVAFVDNFGARDYHGAMTHAAAMVGNSSSGLIEAPSFELPVVNIGQRQAGRHRARNVIDVEPSVDSILGGIKRVLSEDFRASLQGLQNPYGNGNAAEQIAEAIASREWGDLSTEKGFYELDFSIS